MRKFKVRPASEPHVGQWCLQWQTNIMRAPAFWYYNTKQEAVQAKLRMELRP